MIDPEIDVPAYLSWLSTLALKAEMIADLIAHANDRILRYAKASIYLDARKESRDESGGLVRMAEPFRQELKLIEQSKRELVEEVERYVGPLRPPARKDESALVIHNKFKALFNYLAYFLPDSTEVQTIKETRMSGFAQAISALRQKEITAFAGKSRLYTNELEQLKYSLTDCYLQAEPPQGVVTDEDRKRTIMALLNDIWAYDYSVYLRELMEPNADVTAITERHVSRVSEPLLKLDWLALFTGKKVVTSTLVESLSPTSSPKRYDYKTLKFALMYVLIHESEGTGFSPNRKLKEIQAICENHDLASPTDFQIQYNKYATKHKRRKLLPALNPIVISDLRRLLLEKPKSLQLLDNELNNTI